MRNGTIDYLKWKVQIPSPCSFVQGARCTNVNTFGFLPSLPAGSSGKKASELGFVTAVIFKL